VWALIFINTTIISSVLKSSEAALVQIKAIVNPFAPAAQKIVPILIVSPAFNDAEPSANRQTSLLPIIWK
jgi:hypothetical protein